MKKTTRLLLAVLLVAVLCLSLTACDVHEHTYGDWTLTTAPTLTTEGTATRKCTDCNETESVTVPALTDTSVWTATPNPAPTHTTAGKTDYTSIYGKVTVDVDALGDAHVFDQKNTDAKYLKSEATCTSAAVYYYSCVCGEKGTETFTDDEPIAHSYAFSGWATQPTLTEGGVANMECSVCHGTTTVNVAALFDSTVWSKVTDKHVDSSCSVAGKDVYTNATYGEVEVALATTAHTYTFASWETEPTLTEDGVVNLKCANCTATDTATVAKLSDGDVWSHTHTDATFTEAAKDVYTATLYGEEVTITIDGTTKQAPYLGKKYVGMRGTFSSSYTSGNMSISIDENATAKDTLIHKDGDSYGSIMGSYVYSNSKITFSILDDSGKLKITFSWTETDADYGMETEDKSEVHMGYVSADGNYIIINSESGLDKPFGTYYLLYNADALDGYASSGVLAGSSAVVNSLTVGGVEHIVYLEKSSVSFDVAINGEDGTAITVNQISAQSKFTVVTANGTIGFAKSGSSFVKTDGLEGTYTCTDGTTAAIDGLGNVIVSTSEGALNGTYTLNSDGTLDVFVTLADDSNMYLLVTLGEGNTFSYIMPMAEVTFVTNGGTLEGVTDNKTSLNIKVEHTLPVPTYGEAYNFEGWYYDEACTTAVGKTITLADTNAITLYAKVSQKAVVKFVDLIGEDQTYYMAVGDAFLANAPAYTNDTTKDGKLFRGWYVMVDGSPVEIGGEQKVSEADSGETIEIHAKWVDVVTLTKVFGNGQDDEVLSVAQGDVVELDGVNTLYKNGQLLVGWYDNADLSGDAITSLTVDGNTSVYAKWQVADPYVIDNEVSGARNWTYDEATDTWTSNNKGNHNTRAIFILTARENARVTFLYGANCEKDFDYLAIYRVVNGVETELYKDTDYVGDKKDIIVFQNATVELKAGESLKFVYLKDSRTSYGLDIAQIKNLLVIGASHKHAYNKQVVADQYLATEATCQAAATYYYSCICGEHGEETFSHGEKAAHHYENGECTWCHKPQPTFTLTAITNNGDNKTISVKDGETVDLVALAGTKSGYNFEGWYLDREYTQAFDGVIDENVTIYAKWSPAASLAGSTYEGSYVNTDPNFGDTYKLTVIFKTNSDGVLYHGTGTMYYFDFTYVVSGKDITFTIGKNIDGDSHKGQTFLGVISGDTITLKKGTYSSNIYKFYDNNTVTKTSGGSSGSAHIHVYNQKATTEGFLAAAAADCQHHPAYYYSCACGEAHGSETFEDETAVGPHHYEGGVCTGCGAEEPTEKVEVTIDLADGSEATTQQIVKGNTLTLEDPTRSGYKFLGWYIGEDPFVSGETTISADVTITAKWQAEPQSVGKYIGWNLYGDKESGTTIGSFTSNILTINADGTYSDNNTSGTLTEEEAIIVDGSMILGGSYYYFNKEIGVVWRNYYTKKADGVGIDTYVAFLEGTVDKVECCGSRSYGSSYVALLWITYTDGTTKTAFLYNNMIVANVTFPEGRTYENALQSDIVISKDGKAITKLSGNKILSSDGLQGDYTGEETLNINGYGDFVLGTKQGSYTIVAADKLNLFVKVGGKETEFHVVTLNNENGTYTIETPVAHIEFSTEYGAVDSVEASLNIAYTLPADLADDIYIFIGWYKEGDESKTLLTEITPTATDAIKLIALWKEKVTLTVVYGEGLDNAEIAYPKGATAAPVEPPMTNGKIFDHWYTLNGETEVEYIPGAIDENTTIYCAWKEAHPLYGEYTGFETWYTGNGYLTIGKTASIDETGKALDGDRIKNLTANYDPATGVVKFSSYLGLYLASDGILVYNDGTGSSMSSDVHILFKGVKSVTASKDNQYSWNTGLNKLIEVTIEKNTGEKESFTLYYGNGKLYKCRWVADEGITTVAGIYSSSSLKATTLKVYALDGTLLDEFAKKGTDMARLDGSQGTYTCEGAADLILSGTGSATIGDNAGTVTAAADGSNYTYDLYMTESGKTVYYELTIDVEAKTYSLNKAMVTISFDLDGKGTIDSISVNKNVQFSLSDYKPTYEGFVFKDWYKDSEHSSSITSVTPTEDMVVYALWNPLFTVSYKTEHGTAPASKQYEQNFWIYSSDRPTLEAPGYVFKGWYVEGGDGNVITAGYKVIADTVFVAKWVDSVTLTIVYGNGLDTITLDVEPDVSIVAELNNNQPEVTNGKLFDKWYSDEELTTEFTATTISEATTIYCGWKEASKFMGEYVGANFDPSETEDSTDNKTSMDSKLSVNEKGIVTSGTRVSTGSSIVYDEETGKISFKSSSTYNGACDVENGILYFDYQTNKTEPYHDIYVMFKVVDGAKVTSAVESTWNKGCTKLILATYTDAAGKVLYTKTIFIYNRLIYVGVTFDAKTADGQAVTAIGDVYNANTVSVSDKDGNLIASFTKVDGSLTAD